MQRGTNVIKIKSPTFIIKAKFDSEESEILAKYFHHYSDAGLMEEVVFRNRIHHLLGISNEIILERIYRIFDIQGNGSINLDEWLEGLAVILKGNINEIIPYCFKVFDLKSDGFITKSDICYLLKDTLVHVEDNEDPEEEIKNLAKITIKCMDFDQDGRLSFQDFSQAVTLDISLLEAFGHCLPHSDIDLNTIIDFNQ